MGQGPGGIGHDQRPASHLLFTVLFNDTHSLSRFYPVQSRPSPHISIDFS